MPRLSSEEHIILNSVSDGVTVNSQNVFLYVNKSFAKMVGYSVSELIEMNILKVTASEYIDLIEKRSLKRQQGLDVVSIYEAELVRRDGTRLPVEFSNSRIDFDGKSSSLTMVRDISIRKRLEDKLQASEVYYRAIFENAGTAIVVDADSTISRVNTQFEVLSGYSRGEVEGVMKWTDFVVPEYLETMKRYHVDRRTGGQVPKEYVCEIVNKRGQVKRVLVNVELIPGSNQSVVSFLDITELVIVEEQLSEFMGAATDGFVMMDEDMRYIEVNDSWLQMTGLEREDVIGKHALELFPGLKDTGRYDAYLKVLETGEPVEYQAIESASGHGLILDVSVFKAGDSLGAVIRDISERARYQRRLEALHRHAAALASAETIDEVAGLTRESLYNVLGFIRGSLALVEGSILNHKYRWGLDSTEEFVMSLNGPGLTVEVVNTGESIRLGNVHENELFVGGVGAPVTFSELAVPVKVSGKVVAVINIESKVRDAFSEDDQRLVETLASHVAGALSRIKYRDRLSALHSFALTLSKLGSLEMIAVETLRFIEEAFEYPYSAFGVVRDDALWFPYISKEPLPLDFNLPLSGLGLTVKAVRTGLTQVSNDVLSDPDYVLSLSADCNVWSEVCVAVLVQDKPVAVIDVQSVRRDAFSAEAVRLLELLGKHVSARLTTLMLEIERIRVEQEQELGRLKTRFMSTATHELRTPLASIQGYTELIQMDEENLSETQRQYFTVIQRNVHRLTKLTDDLLDQQRLEEGRTMLNQEQVNVMDLLEAVRSEFIPIIAKKNQTLEVNGENAVVQMDRLRVIQVLVNLLSNAYKFSPEGYEIVVDVVETGEGVQFSVSDHGVGIREEDMGKLFTPFPGILVDGNVSGTGLGLSICKGIVELHGGEIWAESEGKGKGSTFSFTIPNRK